MDPNGRSSDQGKRWLFTIYDESDVEKLRSYPHVACVCALEEGTKEQNEHYQVYIKFESNKRWQWFEKLFPRDGRTCHWELARGAEWQNRRYIVDVEAYLRDNPKAHFKTQGRVIHDYGCESRPDRTQPVACQVVRMIADRTPLNIIFRDHPLYFFHHYRKIADLASCVQGWKETGVDYYPAVIEDETRSHKRARTSSDSDD